MMLGHLHWACPSLYIVQQDDNVNDWFTRAIICSMVGRVNILARHISDLPMCGYNCVGEIGDGSSYSIDSATI